MMLLNTTFVVDNALTRSELLRLANEWLNKSRYFDITLEEYNGTDVEYSIESEDGSRKLIVGNYSTVLLLQVICNSIPNADDDSEDSDDTESATYTTNYVLDDTSEKHMLHISQEKIFTEISLTKKHPHVKLPILMKDVFWNEYGGIDGGLVTDDKPYFLRKNDIELAKGIIRQTLDFCNPVVYVSPNSSTGYYSVNPNYLAQELMGQAHVVVESSPKVASDIREAVDGDNPFNGGVKVYLPGTKQSITMLPSKTNYKYFNSEIISTVRDLLATVGIDDRFDATKLRQAHLFEKIKQGGAADEEFTKLCEEMLNDKDAELKQLRNEITELKQSLMTANAKAESLQGSFDKFSEDKEGEVLDLSVTETDLYAGERKDVILKVLQKEYDAMKDDSNLSRSRKFDVLSDVLEHNFPSETDAELIDCIRGAFKDGALSGAGIGRLQAAGFVVEKNGNQAHYRINLNGDERYEAIFSATPSDKARGTKNLVSDFTNILFGF